MKLLYLAKMVALVGASLGQECSVRIDRAVDGHEPRRTNEFLQLLAFTARGHNASATAELVTVALAEAPRLVEQASAAAEADARRAAEEAEAEAEAKARARAAHEGAEAEPTGATPGARPTRTSLGAGGVAPPQRPVRVRGAAAGAAARAATKPRAQTACAGTASAADELGAAPAHGAAATPPTDPPSAARRAAGSALPRRGSASDAAARGTDARSAHRSADERPVPVPVQRAHTLPHSEPSASEWSCHRCGETNERQLGYCERCAAVRRPGASAAGGADAPVLVRPASDSWWRLPEAEGWPGEREGGVSPPRAGAWQRAHSPGAAAKADGADAEPAPRPAPHARRGASGARASAHPPRARRAHSSGVPGGSAASASSRGTSVEEELEATERGDPRAGWFERKLDRQWSARLQRERSVEEGEEILRARAAEAQAARHAASAAAAASEDAHAHRAAQEHAARWLAFVESPPSTIRYADVPWLPIERDDLLCEALGLGGAGGAGSDAAERKRVHRAASMRWHPDKFSQLFGARLSEDEYERIMARVTATSQAINTVVRGAP